MNYPYIHTIRYMGNKANLLEFIIPEIMSITRPGETICDIMAGTNSIGYALKNRNKIISNDIQYYSYILGECLLRMKTVPDKETIRKEIEDKYEENIKSKIYTYFVDNYTDTYFSEDLCREIDSLRYAIENAGENKAFYLTLLMSAMCKAQSTTGHFAQFLPKQHSRVKSLRKISINNLFFEKVEDFSKYVFSKEENLCFNLDYNQLFELDFVKASDCFYLDSPYTTDQYSRFYHILETICKYDYPVLNHKAKYREDRSKSLFCYKKTVKQEFEKIISYCAKQRASLIISYSDHGVISYLEIEQIAKKYYNNVVIKKRDFAHSSQGAGVIDINEILIIMNKENVKNESGL